MCGRGKNGSNPLKAQAPFPVSHGNNKRAFKLFLHSLVMILPPCSQLKISHCIYTVDAFCVYSWLYFTTECAFCWWTHCILFLCSQGASSLRSSPAGEEEAAQTCTTRTGWVHITSSSKCVPPFLILALWLFQMHPGGLNSTCLYYLILLCLL